MKDAWLNLACRDTECEHKLGITPPKDNVYCLIYNDDKMNIQSTVVGFLIYLILTFRHGNNIPHLLIFSIFSCLKNLHMHAFLSATYKMIIISL